MSDTSEPYAAIDLGSNSFHMIVANYVDGRALVVDRIKEMVRLAGGLNKHRQLTDEATERATQCLEKFGQRIKTIPESNVRAVGTNTLRQARNDLEFLAKANTALGHQIEIISGREEARLIYLGVANTIFNETDKRLVVDIGGGSTELIIGQGFDAQITESLLMGCVSISHRFFKEGEINAKLMRKARIAALQEVKNIQAQYQKHEWDSVIGTSGTIRLILNVINENESVQDHITPDALYRLKKTLAESGHVDEISFTSLSSKRKPVFTGGVVVLSAIFEALGIDEMYYSNGALREGLLYDQIGRQHDQDVREKTVNRLMQCYSVKTEFAKQVETAVNYLFQAAINSWKLDPDTDGKMLRWAALLHQIGLAISHSQYHKHGAYLLTHSDLPGFSHQEQHILSLLVRTHRRKFPLDVYQQVTDESARQRLVKLSILLRLGIVIQRGQNDSSQIPLEIKIKKHSIKLLFANQWLQDNPLTEADLASEAEYLSVTDYKLIYENARGKVV